MNLERKMTIVRNFPSHVGGYDATLPEKRCGENDYVGQSCFRDGWFCAVTALNRKLDGESQDEERQKNEYETE